MIRRLKGVALFLLGMVFFAGCGAKAIAPTFTNTTGKLKVAASFYPMYEFTRMVGGEHIELVTLTPVGVEPHDWSPSSGHLKTLNQAAVLVYNGLDIEPWVTKTLKSLDNKQIVAVEASRGLELIKAVEVDDEPGHAPMDSIEKMDPHLWLDPISAVGQVKVIRDALIQTDPTNKASYEINAGVYIKELETLDAEMKRGLMGCGKDEFFTTHSAFGYLTARYGLVQHAMMGLAPDAEPTPKTMSKIVAEAKEHQITYIFFETLVSDKLAKLVAKEIGAQTLVLNPLEGLTDEDLKAGKNYLSVMRDNLANLRLALECK